MNKKIVPGWLLAIVVALLFPASLPARDIILTAPPRESVNVGNQIYGPIAEHIGKLLGNKVTYEHPENWMTYQRDMRNDKYDIVFDGPHFVSWRMAHLGHEVVVKLPGYLQFMLITQASNSNYSSLDDLVGKSICGISPPNLSTLSVLDRFRNPVRQPVIKGINGGMKKVYSSFKASKCDAAVLRTSFYSKALGEEERGQLKQLFLSKNMPNQAISVSPRISTDARRKIAESLTIGEGVQAASGVVKRFGGKASAFIHASNTEYQDHNLLLEGVIFGW